MKSLMLRNGNEIPCVGLGTWQIIDRGLMEIIISSAYEEGYRLIDTAAAYSNEIAVAKAISAKNIRRDELFLSDKVWNTSRGYEAVQEAAKKSLKKLKTDYFDLYLVHWPASAKLYHDWETINADTWRGMEKLYQEGLAKNIGVCNFKVHHLEALKKTAKELPHINQIELHPGLLQKEIIDYCRKETIVIEASSPLGNGKILNNTTLNSLAKKKKVSTAQICLRWAIQKGVVVIPKTSDPRRLSENIDLFRFELSHDEMQSIDGLPYCGGLGIDSDEVTQFG